MLRFLEPHHKGQKIYFVYFWPTALGHACAAVDWVQLCKWVYVVVKFLGLFVFFYSVWNVPFFFKSFLYLHTAAILSSRLVEARSISGTAAAFLPHLWPAWQPAVMCEWRCCHHPQHGSVKWQGERKENGRGGAILNTGTWMLSRSWQHLCVSPATYSHLSLDVCPKAWHVVLYIIVVL